MADMLTWNKDRPAGAHSLYLSANDGNTFTTSNPEHLFTAINKTCADWVADNWEAEEFHVRNHKQYGQ